MRILLATSNPHKLDEIRSIFAAEARVMAPAEPVELLGLGDTAGNIDEPVEDGLTFQANALLKARHYAHHASMHCLAEDSGLEVDALDGEPGVYSARYSGVSGKRQHVDLENNRLLLQRLEDVPPRKRTARFVCTMALVTPSDQLPRNMHEVGPDVLALVRGTVEGRIITTQEAIDPSEPWRGRGSGGFGYDPLFLLPELGCTTAELKPERKNAISHRGQAARQMWRELHKVL